VTEPLRPIGPRPAIQPPVAAERARDVHRRQREEDEREQGEEREQQREAPHGDEDAPDGDGHIDVLA
jgi:hypothetical protein